MELNYIEHNGEKIVFYVQKKKIKNMNLKVNKDKKIILSIPLKMPINEAKRFLMKHISWVKKRQEFYTVFAKVVENKEILNGEKVYVLGKEYIIRLLKSTKNGINMVEENIEVYIKENCYKNPNYIKNIYEKWLKDYSLEVIKELVYKYQEELKEYKIKVKEIEIRKLKSRWGMCIPSKNKVIFSLNLIKTPIECVEYVVLHELAHFEYQNHSQNFYKFIECIMPDWKIRNKKLNTFIS